MFRFGGGRGGDGMRAETVPFSRVLGRRRSGCPEVAMVGLVGRGCEVLVDLAHEDAEGEEGSGRRYGGDDAVEAGDVGGGAGAGDAGDVEGDGSE
ncbi:hypothetical protein GCM10017687_53440 [Streptomyces echinatus]|uniref:Uncharacterized protein n=1 Tax=Streptomyces echinatus TaxID=67293 RepID=A0A7W9PRY5_9ACTN|nr:hypothetical protein [Streptomyces echinatus]